MGLVSGTVAISVNLQDVVSSGYVNAQTLSALLQSPSIPGASLAYTSGTGALQLDGLYFKPLTLAGATTTLQLQSLTGIGGESLTVNRARELILFNPDVHDVKLYQAGTTPWTIAPTSGAPGWARANNGLYRISDPNSVGSGVGNVVTSGSQGITLDPGANTITVYLLVGTSSVA